MPAIRSHATSRAVDLTFAPDYPSPHRLQNAAFFRAALAGMATSTFDAHCAAGRIPHPDFRSGLKRAWRETTIAATVASYGASTPAA